MFASEDDFYFCEICTQQFDIHSLYVCLQRHFFCVSCFNQANRKGKDRRCPHSNCNALIDDTLISKCKGELSKISNKMFPQPTLYSQVKKTASDTDTATFTSRRPLRCPIKNCNLSVSVTSLDSHFRFEHKHVAFIDTVLEARNGLDFHYNDLKLNEALCIVLINIKDTENLPGVPSCSFSLESSTAITQPTLVAMASRIACDDESNFEREGLDDEKMIVWIASNIKTKYSYTLALSTECSHIRIKYYGPLSSINDDHEKLCLEGRGLILNKNQVMLLTENCTKLMSLDILIHCPK